MESSSVLQQGMFAPFQVLGVGLALPPRAEDESRGRPRATRTSAKSSEEVSVLKQSFHLGAGLRRSARKKKLKPEWGGGVRTTSYRAPRSSFLPRRRRDLTNSREKRGKSRILRFYIPSVERRERWKSPFRREINCNYSFRVSPYP